MPKQETNRRRYHRRESRQGIIAAYRDSGLSQRQFCREAGISLSTFSGWLRQHEESAFPELFVPVAVVEEPGTQRQPRACVSPPLELHFRQEWRLVLPAEFDSASVSRLLKLLGELDVCAA